MKLGYYFLCVMLMLSACTLSQAAELLIEDFESYADSAALASNWAERNATVATLGLDTEIFKQGGKSMVVDYNCRFTPYWSETYQIFDANQDWSAYKTLNVWVKGYVGMPPGHTRNQSMENMYAVVYCPKAGYSNPVDHSQLEMLGKTKVYRVTKVNQWFLLQFNLAANYEPLEHVRAIGLGISPDGANGYGVGVIWLDAISLSTENHGGIIEDFERFADTLELQSCIDVNEGNSVSSTMELALALEDANVVYGEKALKFSYNHNLDPYWSKVMFRIFERKSFSLAWGLPTYNSGQNYNPFTINFKVMKGAGKMQLAIIGEDQNPKAYYMYNNGNPITAGDWTRWDINLQSIYDDPESPLNELDAVGRVEIQFVPVGGVYSSGVVYLDEIHVNNCALGNDGTPVGRLRADLNNDCVHDFMDFVAFAEHWQQTGCNLGNNYCEGADTLNYGGRDGKVDFGDLNVMLYRWLDCNMLYQGDCF